MKLNLVKGFGGIGKSMTISKKSGAKLDAKMD